MYRIRVVTDPGECRRLWESLIPREFVSDLWEVRTCFDHSYRHAPYFVVAEERGGVRGFLPLSRNGDSGLFNFFPGETWSGKTWLEQNRIIADQPRLLREMLAAVPGSYHLRYLRPCSPAGELYDQVDEVGYLFCPPRYGFDMERYYEEFSHKTAKKLRRELAGWDDRGATWRFDNPEDFETLVELNLGRYAANSYFYDRRFLEGFRALRDLLSERGWLRMVTILVGGEPAAVDMGAVFNGTMTMLAGGTSANHVGIAKLINVHHMTWACEQKLERVDFLCGDFNWKGIFHLTPAPLYLVQEDKQTVRPEAGLVHPQRKWAPSSLDVGGIANA
ncbi:MAG: GNAT family N-acetyltransferase [Candidatus Zixiibacteriota bacterium]